MRNLKSLINSDAYMDKVIIDCLQSPCQCRRSLNDAALGLFDWHLFLKKAFGEGVDGLLFDNISKADHQHYIPAWVTGEMKQNYMRNLGRNMLISTHLEKVLNEFEANGINLLLLRGIDFLNRLYPNLGMRSMSDVDFVLSGEDLPKAKKILESLGYKHPLNYPYLYDNNCLFIDIHKNNIGSYSLAHSDNSPTIKNSSIWQESVPFKDTYEYVRSLGVYDSIINCCAHLQEHSFSRLIWFYDVAALIKTGESSFDWEKLSGKALEYDLGKPVFYVLRYLKVKQILDVPEEAFSLFDDLKLNMLETRSLKFLLSDRRKDVSGELLYLFSKPGLRAKLKGFIDSVFIKKNAFHLAVERITAWHYLKRFFAVSLYGIRKIFRLLAA